MMKALPKQSFLRSGLLIAAAVLIFGAFGMRLLQIQIVDGDMYQQMVQGHTISTQPIKAVRGEILDRNGQPLVQNKMSYDVVIDLAYLEKGTTNATILSLIGVFKQTNSSWIDNLPLSKTTPFTYLDARPQEVAQLQVDKNLHTYSSGEDAMYWLIQEYKLEEYDVDTARLIAGVRYEMERRDFSLQNPYTFARDVDSPLVIQIKEHSFKLTGVSIETNALRTYPEDTVAPHLLGLVGPLYKEDYEVLKEEGKIFQLEGDQPYDSRGYTMDDQIGKSGIEKALEDQLRGHNGLREIQMDSEGKVVTATESIPPIPGNSVLLTIDKEMQLLLQDSLEAQTKYLAENEPPGRGGNAHAGAGVVVNVKTGEVLAAASYPYYSLTDYLENYDQVARRKGLPLLNRAVLGQYTPGSIYKPVVSLAGLNNKVIKKDSTFFCNHIYTFYAPDYTPQCLGFHGNIGVVNALGWSCNIFFYETGRLTGIEAIDDMAKQLGLGEPTGIELEEGVGQRSNPAVKEASGEGEWYGSDTIQSAIGQLDNLFSPLQLANYAATIANRGKRMELTLVKEVKNYSLDQVVDDFQSVVAHQMTGVSKEAFDITIEGMTAATLGSAGGTFGGYPVSIASKTGTPQVTEEIVNSTYIAFAPVDDPEIAVAIVIEEGWQGYTGAPVAKAVFDYYFNVTDHYSAVQSGPQLMMEARRKEAEEASAKALKEETESDNPSFSAAP